MEAIELPGTAGNIGHKNLVFSTAGDPRAFERLLQGRVRPGWALRCTRPGPSSAEAPSARAEHDT